MTKYGAWSEAMSGMQARKKVLMMISAFGLLFSTGAMAAGQMVMDANILQSACTISFVEGSSNTSTQAVTNITIPAVDPTNMVSTAGQCNDSKCINTTVSAPVTLKLSGCGMANAKTTPQVTLSGVNADPADIPGTTMSSVYQFMFRDLNDAGGTSRDYVVVVGKKQAVQWKNDANGIYGTAAGANNVLTLTGGALGSSGEGAYSTLWLAVSCGYGCQSPTARSGSLHASLNFKFAYN